MFIRVKDLDTGHEYDLPEGHRLIRLGLVKPVKPKQYPPAARARRAKHNPFLSARTSGGAHMPGDEPGATPEETL